MKGFLQFIGAFVLILIAVSTCGGESEKYPIVYYHTDGQVGNSRYILNKDETFRIETRFKSTIDDPHIIQTSWHRNGGNYWIKQDGRLSMIIKEDYLYQNIDDANAKRYGVKLTKMKQK